MEKVVEDRLFSEKETLHRLYKIGLVHEDEFTYAMDILEDQEAEI